LHQPLNILTLATGKKLFVDMAVNLARSFILRNKGNNINFYIATDLPQYLPEDIKGYTQIIQLKPNELGIGFSPKLHLDKLAPQGQTLFIDSDCLIYGNLLPLFTRFKGHHVSVVGGYIATGEWFGDVVAICKKYNIEHLPKFNGGIYYLENGPIATKVYETARELETQYDEIGFVRLRGRPNDEVLMALAMQLHDQTPIADDGTLMSDPLSCPAIYVTDVISGKNYLVNPPAPNPLHQEWYPFNKVSPLVIHFLGHHSADYQYQKDTYRLKKWSEGRLNFITEANALINIELKKRSVLYLKNKFRSLYHALFGVRRINPTDRV
jgi:hypothetical protein